MKYVLMGAIILFAACSSGSTPSGIIPPDKMKTIMWDLLRAGELSISDTTAAIRLHLRDSTTARYQTVLAIHEINKDDFLKSLRYYEAHPDKQKIMIDSLLAYGTREELIVDKRKQKTDSLKNARRLATLKLSDSARKQDSLQKLKPADSLHANDTQNRLKTLIDRKKLMRKRAVILPR